MPSTSALGRDRIHVDNHNILVNFIAVSVKRDKHTSGRKAKASGKRKKKAHKRGSYFFQKPLWVLKPKITMVGEVHL